MKVWIQGITGKMGNKVQHFVNKSSTFELYGGSSSSTTSTELCDSLSKVDAVIDFSTIDGSSALFNALETQLKHPKYVLLATTGVSEEKLHHWKKIAEEKRIALLIAPNTSVGILNLYKCILRVCQNLIENGFDAELFETHHRYKVDSPSGTALFLAEALKKAEPKLTIRKEGYLDGPREAMDVGVHALRGGGVFGEHEVRFISDLEEVYIGHRALSRDLFAKGAVSLLSWLSKKSPGIYSYEEIADS